MVALVILSLCSRVPSVELATHAPLIIHLPGMGGGSKTMSYSEHVDLFPTLAEAAAGVRIPRCPSGPAMLNSKPECTVAALRRPSASAHDFDSYDVRVSAAALCTMGNSLVPILHDPTATVATASFSQ